MQTNPDPPPPRIPYLPTRRQLAVILTVGAACLGYAFYLRYMVVEQSTVGLACEAGQASALCTSRRVAIALFTHSVFGMTAIAAALLNLIRPGVLLLTAGLVTAAFGIVLYNVTAASLAVALLIFSLARPRMIERTEAEAR
jgi:hypothetical protein